MQEVTRILEEGTASHESTQEMTGKIAHAASLTHLSAVDSGEGAAQSNMCCCLKHACTNLAV